MSYRMIWFCDVLCIIEKDFITQLNVKLYKITWYSIICVALPGILLPYLHIHLNPNRCGLFVGFWLGIFAIHKTWTSLAFWWRIDDKTGTLAYPVWCIVWVVQTQLFAENSNRGRKVSPEKLKSSHSRRFLLEKSKNSKNSKSRKVEKFEKFEKSKSSKNSKSRKVRKNRKVEKFRFQEISARKIRKMRKVENFLTFCEKFCNFRAVRLPARRALRVHQPTVIYSVSMSLFWVQLLNCSGMQEMSQGSLACKQNVWRDGRWILKLAGAGWKMLIYRYIYR